MKLIINQFLLRFIELRKNCLLLHGDFSLGVKGMHSSLFFDNTDFKYKTVGSYNYFKEEDPNKYDLIIAELPLGLRNVKNKDFKFSINQDWELIYFLTKKLTNDGLLIVNVAPLFNSSVGSKRFLNELENKGIFLNALIEMPEGKLMPLSQIQPNIAIFSKKNNFNKLFLASLNETDNEEIIYKNLLDDKSNNDLASGDIIDGTAFKGFVNYRINKSIESLQTEYKDYDKKLLGEVIFEINNTKTSFSKTDGNYLYIPKLGNLNVFCDFSKLDKKQHNFYQLEVNEKIVRSKYLECYFKSDIGQLSLKSLLKGSFIKVINLADLKELVIPIPSLEVQENLINSYSLLDSVILAIDKLKENLSLSPSNAKKINEKLVGTLDVLNELSKSDKIMSFIRHGESLRIEFKQTFCTDVVSNKKEKYIEESSLKNIAGFLNKQGGVLLIGVKDDGDIYGISKDSYQSDDKYLLHFKNKLKEAIGEEFFDLIEYEIVEVNSKKVLYVEVRKSDKPVYLYKKDFYVRANPATDKLEGPKLVEYIKTHFK